MTPEDLMRSTTGPACTGTHKEARVKVNAIAAAKGLTGASPAQLYAGSVAGKGLNPSGITFGMPWRTSSGVIPMAAHPLPP